MALKIASPRRSPASAAPEQDGSQLVLQRLDAGAYSGLGDMQALRCAETLAKNGPMSPAAVRDAADRLVDQLHGRAAADQRVAFGRDGVGRRLVFGGDPQHAGVGVVALIDQLPEGVDFWCDGHDSRNACQREAEEGSSVPIWVRMKRVMPSRSEK